MPRVIVFVLAVVALLPHAAAGAEGWSRRIAVARPAEKEISSWPAHSRGAARVFMARYGMPDEVAEDALIWRAKGPWKKTIVHRRSWLRYAFWSKPNCVESAISHEVPKRSLADLTRFDDRITADPERAELSASSASEEENLLALNLADEIVNGRRTVEDARALRDKILRLADSGKSSSYLKGLLFAPNGGAFSPANPYP